MKLFSCFIVLAMVGCIDEVRAGRDLQQKTPVFCERGSSYEILVHPDITAESLEEITWAAGEWNSRLNGKFPNTVRVTRTATSKYASCEINVFVFEGMEVFASSPSLRNEGTDVLGGGIIAVSNASIGALAKDKEFLRSLFLHELGHQLGLEHDEDPEHRSIMWPKITTSGGLGCEDVRRACAIWGCTPSCEGNNWL